MFSLKLKPISLAVMTVFAATSAAYAADAIKADKVEVVSQTPLPGIGVSINEIPANIQTIKGEDIQKSHAIDLSSYMNQNLSSVYINETQGNPLQGDLNYRGYTASPLLGTPQGISVYMDGVRLNQPFGDVVSWDLIPKNAIKSVQLMPGSNPLFGLNTLGGALSIQTKDGRSNQGGAVQMTYGSFARKIGEFEYGGVSQDNSVDYFIAGTWFDENGWRKESPSESKQLFGKIGWQGEKTDLKLTYAYADTDLNGNGTVSRSQLATDRSAVYTYPDNTKNESNFLNLNFSHFFKDNVMLTGNAYYRHIKTNTINGDINDTAMGAFAGDLTQIIGDTGSALYNPSYAACLTNATDAAAHGTGGGEPGEKCSGLITRTRNSQDNAGLQAQISVDDKLWGMDNKYILGAGYDWSQSHYVSASEYGKLASASWGSAITGIGFLADSNTMGNLNGSLDDRAVDLKGTSRTYSMFMSDTLKPVDKLSLTGALRYNRTEIDNKDQLNHMNFADGVEQWRVGSTYYSTFAAAQTANPLATSFRYYPSKNLNLGALTQSDSEASLTGNHQYQRVNPSIGFAWDVDNRVNVFGSYSESSRAPTSIELGCANPDQGCRLPNAMSGDPHLNQVVSKTYEIGARGNIEGFGYSTSFYSSTNENDIMFVANSTSEGYFKNFGETRRRGLEFALAKEVGSVTIGGNYSYIDATYQSDETVGGAGNSAGTNLSLTDPTAYSISTCSAGLTSCSVTTPAAGETLRVIDIKKGNRIPGVPEHMAKLFVNWKLTDKVNLAIDSLIIGSTYVRGNENNAHQAGGSYNGSGSLSGYALFNLSAAYNPTPEWTLFARVNNLFDKDYETAGQLGLSPYGANGSITLDSAKKATMVGETFVAPGAPRSAWIGVRYEFGGPTKK